MLRTLDAAYYRVERVVVVTALVVMSLTVCLDVVTRRLANEGSLVTSALLWPKARALRAEVRASRAPGGADADEIVERRLAPLRATLDRWVSPGLTVALLLLVLIAAARTARRDAPPAPGWIAPAVIALGGGLAVLLAGAPARVADGATAAAGLVAAVAAWRYPPGRVPLVAAAMGAGLVIFARTSLEAPSHVAYAIIAVATGVGAALRLRSRGRKGAAAAAFLAGLAVAAACPALVPEGYSWAKEVALNLLLWVGFVGASMASHTRRHIFVDFVRKVVPARARPAYEVASAAIAALFCAFLAYLGYLYVFGAEMSIYALGARLDYSGLPSWVGVAAIPLGLATAALRFAGTAVAAARGVLPESAGGHGLPGGGPGDEAAP